jgi:MFS family permease
MWLVGGEWTVAKGCVHSHNPIQLLIEYRDLILEGVHYLATCSFAMLVTLKSSCAIIIGGADVLNVQLSHQAEDEDRDSTRLGILLAMFGLGFFIGPLVSDRFISMKQPRSILGACVIGFALIFMGFIGMGLSTSFHSICFSTVIRGSGSSVLWINSTLLLQVMYQ